MKLKECSQYITAELIRQYAALTNDYNPIHIDPDFAATTPAGTIIAHGTLSVNLIWQSLAYSLGAAHLDDGILDIRFVAPVRIGDTITAGGCVLADRADAYDVWAMNHKGEKTITGTFSYRS